MTDLLGLSTRIDDAVRAIDRAIANGNASGMLEPIGLSKLASDMKLELAAAMPTSFGAKLDSNYVNAGGSYLGELASLRTKYATANAVVRAVHELGGVDHVVSQGGLDAIEGAAQVIRRHLFVDAADQLRLVTEHVESPPSFVGMSKKARGQHLTDVYRSIVAPLDQLGSAGIVDTEGDALVQRLRELQGHYPGREAYESVLRDVRAMVAQVRNMSADELPAAADTWSEGVTVSARARAVAAENAARATLPVAPRLSTLADPASVLANSTVALDQHIATLDALTVAVGSARIYDQQFKDALRVAGPKLDRAVEDLRVVEQLLVDAPDSTRDMGFLARDWVEYLAKHASGTGNNFHSNYAMLPNARTYVGELRDHVARIAEAPFLLQAGTDTADEVKDLLARPGAAIDLDALGSLLDGDNLRAARGAFVEHVAALKPHAADTPPTTDVQESIRLLDEGLAIGRSVKTGIEKNYWRAEEGHPNDPEVVDAVRELLHRADTASGTHSLVAESTGASLTASAGVLRDKLPVTTGDSWKRARIYELDNVLARMTSYRDELASVSERASVDGGLRSISPSARPQQALEARSRWIIRELDAIGTPANDAPPIEHIETAARRATVAHQLIVLADDTSDATAKAALLQRASSEISALGETWRMPDDVAFDLARLREDIARNGVLDPAKQMNATLPGYNTSPVMDATSRVASGLQAWAMLTDGALPETRADRLAVAHRRAVSARAYLDEIAGTRGDEYGTKHLASQLADLRRRITDIDDIVTDLPAGPARASLDEGLRPIDVEIERQAAVRAKYQKPGNPADEVFSGRTQLDDWVDWLANAHLTARASEAEQLAW